MIFKIGSIIILGLGGCWLALSLKKIKKAAETKSWPSVTGKLLSKEEKQYESYQTTPTPTSVLRWEEIYNFITYTYIVNNKDYQYSLASNNGPQSEILLFYNPKDPAESMQVRGIQAGHLLDIFLSIGLIVLSYFIFRGSELLAPDSNVNLF